MVSCYMTPLVGAERQQANPLLGFVQTSASAALAASARVRAQVREYDAQAEYPDSQLADKMRIVAQLIEAEMGGNCEEFPPTGWAAGSRGMK